MTNHRLRLLLFCCMAIGLGLLTYRGLFTHPPVAGGPFTLTDITGKTITDRSYRGKYLLLYFGYTWCPDVCPATMATITEALDELGEKAAQIQPVFVSLDPARDTPAVLADYVSHYSPRWQGLTGTPEQLTVIEKEFHVYVAKHATGPKPDDYIMDHSSIVYLMDAGNGKFPGADRCRPADGGGGNRSEELKSNKKTSCPEKPRSLLEHNSERREWADGAVTETGDPGGRREIRCLLRLERHRPEILEGGKQTGIGSTDARAWGSATPIRRTAAAFRC